jgi:hypothetical protein
MKQKLIIIFYLLFIIATISCNQVIDKTKDNNIIELSNNNKTLLDKNGIVKNENEPQIVALQFYKWYLKDIYLKKDVESPEIVLTKDSVFVLDATKHKNFLKTSGYFSQKFYENEIGIFIDCENKLKFIKWAEVEKSGAVNPADFVEGNECDFTSYKVWTNGQGEPFSRVEIQKYTTKNDISLVVLNLSDSLQGGFYSKPYVSMIKENGKWKISKIRVGFE